MAEFSLLHADGYAASGNSYAVYGTLTRVASFLTQALFALNERYFMSDKTALKELADFRLLPENYIEGLTTVLAHTGQSIPELQTSVARLRALWSAVREISAGE